MTYKIRHNIQFCSMVDYFDTNFYYDIALKPVSD